MTELENKVQEEADKVQDPETGLTFTEMQMITNVKEEEPGIVKIEIIRQTNFSRVKNRISFLLSFSKL